MIFENRFPKLASACLGLSSLLVVSALAGAAHAEDLENGASVFRKCRACHDVGPAAKNKVGPHLNGVFGRTAGSVAGFNYSSAMSAAGTKKLVWDEETLNGYLEQPTTYLPKNKMAFAGIKDEKDRADLIAFLKTLKP
ncbi:MAG: cytochrome c family protein [Hyphomicrobiaceae bacterium]|nr:cytochrome c family protein [Hyphomicrobiaceae bacterium]